jgi:hypothetical protein
MSDVSDMRGTAGVVRRLLPVVIAGALLASCRVQPVAAPQCQQDVDCGTLACVAGTCIARATIPDGWAIELDPRSGSNAGFTEFPPLSVPTGPLNLAADGKVTVTGTLLAATGGASVTSAHVVVSVAPAISGRPDLQFEVDLAGPMGAAAAVAAPQFALAVPAEAMGRLATVQILPLSPEDATFAPLTFRTPLAESMTFRVSSQAYAVTGRFFDAFRQPRIGFLARAFRDGQLVSNVDVTDNAGSFGLSIPIATVAQDPQTSLYVELRPKDPTATDPRFSSMGFLLSGSLDLGSLYEAAFTQPNVFRFNVRGASNAPVVGAIVRAHTVLDQGTASGSTDFLRDGTTDASGNADLALLPGTATAARAYTVSIVSPSDSAYASECLPAFMVSAGGTVEAPLAMPPIVLAPRLSLTGQVRAADQTPVAGVAIVATPVAAVAASPTCDSTVGVAPSSVNTDASGHFTLLLDGASYRLDYDPPAGSPVPRLTEPSVTIFADLAHDAILSPGALVEGDAVGPDQRPLGMASVRLYDPSVEPGAVTVLRAQARTDANGHLRAVIPLP